MAGAKPRSTAVAAKHERYRLSVLTAAERVFGQHGYEDARMEEIARGAGIALGTLYSVFDGKAEIYAAVHERGDAELMARIAEATTGSTDALAGILAGVRAYARFFCERPDFLRIHLWEGHAWGPVGPSSPEEDRSIAFQQGLGQLTEAFAACMRDGLFEEAEPRVSARMMIAMQQVQLSDWIECGMKRSPDELIDEMVNQIVRSFGTAKLRSKKR